MFLNLFIIYTQKPNKALDTGHLRLKLIKLYTCYQKVNGVLLLMKLLLDIFLNMA